MAGSFSVQQRCLLSLLLVSAAAASAALSPGLENAVNRVNRNSVLVDRLQSGGDTEPISIRQASNSENQCDYDYLEANETVASCGDLSFTLAGFTISGDSVPVSPACANPRASIGDQRSACIRKYILDLATGKPTPQCKFSKPQKTTRRGCCPGYGGENCQQVVCFPKDGGCQNGGRCVKPDKCECQSGFQGAMCDEDLAELQKDTRLRYCFSDASCKVKNTKFGRKTTPFSDCCSAGGNSFGYSGVCTACTSSTGTRSLGTPTGHSEIVPFDTCSSFGPNSISTFDGLTYEFEGRCSYLLAGSINPSRRWFVKVAMVNCDTFKSCQKTLRFRLDDLHEFVAVGQSLQVYQISGLDGAQMLKVNDSFQGLFDDARDYSGVRFIRRGDSIIMTSRSLGLRLRWDSIGSVQLTLDRPVHSNQDLQGLCGNYDGDKKNEFGEFANPSAFGNAWKAQDCPDSANVPVHCPDTKTTASAEMECRQIDSIFFPCHDRIPPQEFFQRCVQDACLAIRRGEPTSEVVCRHLSAYAGLCSLGGICIDWRSSNLCPTNCSEPNMYWKECASECPTTCANYDQVKSELCQVTTSPRCECEPDYVHHKGKCVRKTDCPCRYNGKEFPAGGTFNTQCESCQCIQGRWSCYKRASCPKTCLVTGSSFRTFDGAQLDFNGRTCEYVLLEPAPNVTDSRLNVTITQRVRTENVLITDPNQLANLPKRVHISYAAYRIELVATSLNYGSRASVFINDEDVTNSLPFSNQDDHLLVKQITSLTTMVKIGSHITVYFDGFRNIEIKANERVRSNVKGLCGNYDGDTENDLHPRNSDMFGSVTELAESYITGVCTDSPIPLRQAAFADQVSGSDHCQLALLTGDSFKACRESNKVDLNGHYLRSCRREVASGGVQGQQFLFCSSLVQAAIECKNQGYDVDFYRDSVLSLCAPPCRVGGGTFSLCSRTCRSTCSDLESTEICEEGCFPGCDCQYDSQYRDHHGTCVRKSECTCRDRFNPDSAIYKAGDVLQRSCTNCTCSNGAFVCEDEACEDKVVCPKNQVFMDLVPSCQRCEDYNNCPRSAMLQKRCGCPGGQVKKSDGTCVPANQCPCKLLKKEYPPMHKLKMACKRFVCKDQTWKQIGKDRKCEAVCKAQGDPHYFTFDKKKFNFQGKCQYTLVSFDGDASRGLPKFHISAQNVPCGSKQVTCTKFVRIIIGDERYTLVRGQEKDEFPAPFASYGVKLEHLTLYTQVVSDVLGLRILWDRKTRVLIYLRKDYRRQVSGLCGNYDGNAGNDFTFNNLPMASVDEWAEKYRTGAESCPAEDGSRNSNGWRDICEQNPGRKTWSELTCGVIKNPNGPFKDCLLALDDDTVQTFYENCIFDACGCDSGGDCECVCSAMAGFADHCSDVGVHVKWRSMDNCPLMCDGGKRYMPCMEPCPQTCRNLGDEPAPHCQNAACTEGCGCPRERLTRTASASRLACAPASETALSTSTASLTLMKPPVASAPAGPTLSLAAR
ncbi:hypothetical protein BOX15_Mlig009912g1 [Macrostomum lignano]|uniref:VWFD domain-containing protein n=1 Tax=Macrostomum lignano TaxID=282301 RepID=A0A267FD04_9PLAT|nr:hypothetical protein BOX15_Mlig009912g1 [Macrostomum lignano]